MDRKYLIIGGSNGLGKEITNILSKSGSYVVSISRSQEVRSIKEFDSIKMDLAHVESEDFYKIIAKYDGFDGICFAQRFRPEGKSNRDFHTEVDVMVTSIAKFMEALILYQDKLTNIFSNIAVICSNYSTHVGLDQPWEYHCIKSSQLSLVRYFSHYSNGKFVINSFSPATYIKPGSEEYWKTQKLSDIWKRSPSQRLFKAQEIAHAICRYMQEKSDCFNGNNIYLDGGFFNIYPDQI